MTDVTKLRDLLRVKPGGRLKLSDYDPAATHGWHKDAAASEMTKIDAQLADLQDRLWAGAQKSVLIVLQGIDASGKDGTIRRVMTTFNPQGCNVASFKVPTAEETGHDFLWRIHKRTPGKGEIAIFNRSHYEQVLVVRVHKLEPRTVWSRHYDQINEFEELLAESGTTVVKFFLHITKDEQRQRFQDRYDNQKKRWKFSMSDLAERELWNDYMTAYQEALSRTSTDKAPWYVIPANRNWMRNLAVASILAQTMAELKPAYPPEPDLPKNLVIK